MSKPVNVDKITKHEYEIKNTVRHDTSLISKYLVNGVLGITGNYISSFSLTFHPIDKGYQGRELDFLGSLIGVAVEGDFGPCSVHRRPPYLLICLDAMLNT